MHFVVGWCVGGGGIRSLTLRNREHGSALAVQHTCRQVVPEPFRTTASTARTERNGPHRTAQFPTLTHSNARKHRKRGSTTAARPHPCPVRTRYDRGVTFRETFRQPEYPGFVINSVREPLPLATTFSLIPCVQISIPISEISRRSRRRRRIRVFGFLLDALFLVFLFALSFHRVPVTCTSLTNSMHLVGTRYAKHKAKFPPRSSTLCRTIIQNIPLISSQIESSRTIRLVIRIIFTCSHTKLPMASIQFAYSSMFAIGSDCS